jgi:hypothetical protein
MTIQVTGKSLDVGEALRGYVQERVVHTVEKFIGREPAGHVRIEKEDGVISVVYRREDGNIGWIDPATGSRSSSDLPPPAEAGFATAGALAHVKTKKARKRR